MPGQLENRVTRFDRQTAAIQKLIVTGMKLINNNAVQIKALTAAQRETDRQLKETDRILKDLMRSSGRRDQTNGHGKPPRGMA